jgi:hypothetical protein
MRTNFNRNLILLITSMTMLTITIIVGCATPTPTATFISITPDQYSSTVISSYGLSLSLSLNSTTYHSGEQISVTIDERNILAVENNIRAANEWPVQGVVPINSCDLPPYPFRISILQGYYDAKSVASIPPLQLIDPNVAPFCPMKGGIISYDFQPGSDVAAIYTTRGSEPSWSINMTAKVTSAGFWTSSHPNATFSSFTPGIYTIVGGDEWGALVTLHFTIS